MMTVREKMDDILNNNPNYQDSGEYRIDGRDHGILQNMNDGSIKIIYKSSDDIDDDGNPVTAEMDYRNLKELLSDFPLSY